MRCSGRRGWSRRDRALCRGVRPRGDRLLQACLCVYGAWRALSPELLRNAYKSGELAEHIARRRRPELLHDRRQAQEHRHRVDRRRRRGHRRSRRRRRGRRPRSLPGRKVLGEHQQQAKGAFLRSEEQRNQIAFPAWCRCMACGCYGPARRLDLAQRLAGQVEPDLILLRCPPGEGATPIIGDELVRPSPESVDHLGEARQLGGEEAIRASLLSALMIPAVKDDHVDVFGLLDAFGQWEERVNGIATPLGGARGWLPLAQRRVKAVHLSNLVMLGHKATATARFCSTTVRAFRAPRYRLSASWESHPGTPSPLHCRPLLRHSTLQSNPVTSAKGPRLQAPLHAMKSTGSPSGALRSTPTRTPESTDGPRFDPSAIHGSSLNQWFIASGRASTDASAMPLEPALWTPPFYPSGDVAVIGSTTA